MDFVLGIDGGGTGTRAWVVRFDGTVPGRGQAGPSNVHQLGVDAARRSAVEATTIAWNEAGLPGEKPCAFRAIFAGVAGAGAVEDQRALGFALAAEFGVTPAACVVDHDLRVALAGALAAPAAGVVLLVGTGSAAYGRSADGRSWRAGGWGPWLDDAGSGHWLGAGALRLVLRAADGRSTARELAEEILRRLELASSRALIDAWRDGALDQRRVADLAPLVLARAEAGGPEAQQLLRAGARELAAMAQAVVYQISGDARGPPLPLAGTGGVLKASAVYRAMVAEELGGLLQRPVALASPVLSPVAGAALLALNIAGATVDQSVVERLRARDREPDVAVR